MADRPEIEYPKAPIMVHLNCPKCDKIFNAVIDRDSFGGPFDDTTSGRVRYGELLCAGCDRVLAVEIPCLTPREEAACTPKMTVIGGGFKFNEIPVYFGKVVSVHGE